jgi:8-oxo-dGTP diphosphatase
LLGPNEQEKVRLLHGVPNVTKYVVGFYYVTHPNTVLLIRKKRPDWQKGLLNGVGGHVENDESDVAAMRREFEEEAGIDVIGWRAFLEIKREPGFHITFFYFKGDRDEMNHIHARTDEKLEWHAMTRLPDDIVPNLAWIIPLSLEREIEGPLIINYK